MKKIVMTITTTIQDMEEEEDMVIVAMEGVIDGLQMMRRGMTMITSVHIKKEVQNFDINQQSIRLLADYWIEDTQLLKFLHDSNTLSYKNIYDDLERCIDPSSNNGKFFYLVTSS